jgi:hypothetical protein
MKVYAVYVVSHLWEEIVPYIAIVGISTAAGFTW